MTIRNVTVTSKNQITLPSEYVKNLKLTQSRVLSAELQEGRIVLTPQPSLDTVMKQFWGKHKATKPLTDSGLKQAIRSTSANRVTKSNEIHRH
jgi:bifunctional DNA-binding transcriptional regulator/antitoxin component of YhaV-PrlF toxin-antitoxin module